MSKWREQVEDDFVKNINDTYTLNLAISILEDRENFREEIDRLNQEIIGLNNCIIEFHSEFCNKQAEINRLNNIINELKAILKSKGYETYIPALEGEDKE